MTDLVTVKTDGTSIDVTEHEDGAAIIVSDKIASDMQLVSVIVEWGEAATLSDRLKVFDDIVTGLELYRQSLERQQEK